MLLGNVDNEKLFSKCVAVTVKDNCTNQCRTRKLLLTVEWQISPAAIHRKELVIILTDADDPFFLYTLYLREEDFQTLKVTQCLLVDFTSFPKKFIDLLESCIQEEGNAQPKFLLILNLEDKICSTSRASQLDVVETNPFKHLIHLSLNLLAATDSVVKQYLGVCFKNLKDEKMQLQKNLTFVEQDLKKQLSACQETLSSKIHELEMVRKDMNMELSSKENRHGRIIQEERERLMKKHREEEDRFEREWREKEHSSRRQIQQLEARVSCLDALNKEIQDKNYNYDRSSRDMKTQIQHLEDELQKAKERLHKCNQHGEGLQLELREKNLLIGHQKDKIAELEQQRMDKSEFESSLQQQLEFSREQKRSLEVELEKKSRQIETIEEQQKAMTFNVSKSNDIIQKLFADVSELRQKLQTRTMVNLKQEEAISEKDQVIRK